MHPYDLTHDDMLEQYISLLKSLSQRLHQFPLPLFINNKYPYLPILQKVIVFFTHPDQMIRSHTRNIFLSILGNQQPIIISLLSSYPYITVYTNLCLYLVTLWTNIGQLLRQPHPQSNKMKALYDESQDTLSFIDDLIQLNIQPITCIILNALITISISYLSTSITTHTHPLPPQLSYHLIYQLYHLISSPTLNQLLITLFTQPTLLSSLHSLLNQSTTTTTTTNMLIKDKDNDYVNRMHQQLIDYQSYTNRNTNLLYNLYYYQSDTVYKELLKYYQSIASHLGVIVDQSLPDIQQYASKAPLKLLHTNALHWQHKIGKHKQEVKEEKKEEEGEELKEKEKEEEFVNNKVMEEYLKSMTEDNMVYYTQLVLNVQLQIMKQEGNNYDGFGENLVYTLVNHLKKRNINVSSFIIILNNLESLIDFRDKENICYQYIVQEIYQQIYAQELLQISKSQLVRDEQYTLHFIKTFESEYQKHKLDNYGQLNDIMNYQSLLITKQKNFSSIYRKPMNDDEYIHHQIIKYFFIKKFQKRLFQQESDQINQFEFDTKFEQIFGDQTQLLEIDSQFDLKSNTKLLLYCRLLKKDQQINFVIIEDNQNIILGEVNEEFTYASIKHIISLQEIQIEQNIKQIKSIQEIQIEQEKNEEFQLIIIDKFKKYNLVFAGQEQQEQARNFIYSKQKEYFFCKLCILQNYLYLETQQ